MKLPAATSRAIILDARDKDFADTAAAGFGAQVALWRQTSMQFCVLAKRYDSPREAIVLVRKQSDLPTALATVSEYLQGTTCLWLVTPSLKNVQTLVQAMAMGPAGGRA